MVLVLFLGGCEGDRVEPASTPDAASDSGGGSGIADTGPDSEVDAADAGVCGDVAGNLVPNASFEDTITGWDSGLERMTGGADDCTHWAKLTTTEAWGKTLLTIPIAGKAGDVYEFGASVQRLDEEGAIDVFLLTPTSLPESHVEQPLPAKGVWARAVGKLTLTEPVDHLLLGIGANTTKPRVMGIDRAWVVKK